MMHRLNRNLGLLKPSGIRRFSALARETEGCIMLTIGEPDFNTPENIKTAAKMALDANRTHYPANPGDVDVRTAISAFERTKRGLNYDPEEIIVTCGATEGIYTAMCGVLNPGDEVIIPQPAFGLYESIATLCGAKVVPLDTSKDAFQIDPAKLEAAITENTKLLILNSPNNPTGVAYTQDTLDGIKQALEKREIFILCDDVYLGLSYGPCPMFAAFHELRDRLLVVQSFSKPYAMTGWRLGYLMADRPLIDRLKLVHAFAVVSVAAYAQDACIEALRTDVSEMVEIYRKRRDLICSRLRGMGLDFVEPDGAFYVFPSIEKYGMGSEEFCLRMIREGKLAAVPGICFGAEGYIRLSFCYSTEEIARGMDRLEAFLQKLEFRNDLT